MSKVADVTTGEDHAEAAKRHHEDGELLYANGHYAGASYLFGYVIECSIKTALLVAGHTWPKGAKGHDLEGLSRSALSVASTLYGSSSKEVTSLPAAIQGYDASGYWIDMRYLPASSRTQAEASNDKDLAESVYLKTVGEFELNGQI